MKRFAGLTLLLVTGWLGIPGSAADVRLQDADLAWDRGDYPTALRGYLAILGAGAPDDVADAIALQTGELFKTTEITADGGAPRFSPDGRYFTYEVGRGASRRTRLAKTDAPVETSRGAGRLRRSLLARRHRPRLPETRPHQRDA